MSFDLHVTVAAVIERDGKFLLVEEHVGERVVLNQPAGHLDPGESLVEAVVRETREETGHAFEPEHLVGIYLWANGAGTTFLRAAFCGACKPPSVPAPKLDEGIIGFHWLTRAQMLARAAELRTPMVLRCVDDYLAGSRHSLDVLAHLSVPEARSLRAQS